MTTKLLPSTVLNFVETEGKYLDVTEQGYESLKQYLKVSVEENNEEACSFGRYASLTSNETMGEFRSKFVIPALEIIGRDLVTKNESEDINDWSLHLGALIEKIYVAKKMYEDMQEHEIQVAKIEKRIQALKSVSKKTTLSKQLHNIHELATMFGVRDDYKHFGNIELVPTADKYDEKREVKGFLIKGQDGYYWSLKNMKKLAFEILAVTDYSSEERIDALNEKVRESLQAKKKIQEKEAALKDAFESLNKLEY